MSIVCKECEIHFSNMSNLRAHIKRKHPDRLEELAPKKVFQSVVPCEECDKTFVNNSNLKIHMKSKHSDKLVDMKVKHLKCNICEFSHNCKEELMLHFKNSHAIEVEKEKFEFASLEDFLVWKNQIEKETASSFVNMHGSNKNKSFTRTKYTCHRSGAIRRGGNNLRHLKSRGSCKINAFCPACIDVIVKNGKYEVEFIKTHVGHKQEIGYLFLTPFEKQELASKIASKVPFQSILDDVRDSLDNSLERLHLLKKKDLYNIEHAYNLNNESVCLVFMTDMAESFYNAWIQIMDPPQFRLFCTWHVDKAWRKNLDKITDQDNRVQVYKMLRVLLQERDERTFLQLLENFLNVFKGRSETSEFANYFAKYYTGNTKSWAYCYRLNCGLNTNMHLERMHRTLKHLYLNGKFVKRLDKAISAIMKFVRDKLFERLIVIHSGKLTSKLRDLRKRHKTSLSLNFELIIQTEMGWEVPSNSTGEIYVIQEIKSKCTCQLVCDECEACLHRYSCTCLDCSVRWNMCKHIHLICLWKKNYSIANSTKIKQESDVDDLVIDVDAREVESFRLVECISRPKGIQQSRPNLQEEINKIKDEILANLATVTSFEELEIIKRNFAPIQPSLCALRQQNARSLDFKMKCSSKIPSNKKTSPQRRLFSTRKQ